MPSNFVPGAGTAYSVAQTQMGLAIEPTRGTAVPPAFWEPLKGPKYKPVLNLIPDDTLQGSMVSIYDLIPGLRYDSHGWDSYVELDSFPLFVRAEWGSADTVTAAPTSTTLSAAASAGATTVTTAASVAVGSWVSIGASPNAEGHQVTAVTGETLTLNSPLVYNHASGAAVTGLTTHVFSLANNTGGGTNESQPPSVTITDFDGDQWRQITAAQLDALTVKGNASGLVDYTCTWFGNPSQTPTTPTPSYSGEQPSPGWTTTCLVGGTQLYYVEDFEFDWKRNVKPIPALTGTEEYFMFFADTISATGKLTVVEQQGAPQEVSYINASNQTLDFTFFDLTQGAVMNIHSTNAKFNTWELERSNGWVKSAITFTQLPSAADATSGGVSPGIITIANSHTSAY